MKVLTAPHVRIYGLRIERSTTGDIQCMGFFYQLRNMGPYGSLPKALRVK